MNGLMRVVLSLMVAGGLSGMAVAGSIDSPGAPSAGSGMYTLQNLYDYLTSGTALTVQSGFQEPSAAPGSTMKTTREIGDAIKALHDQCNVTADNVELGKTFFCKQPGSWGVQTGTLVALPRPTATPTITPTSTPTPTITPIPWDQNACAAYGGYWALLGSDVTGYGCWFDPHNAVESCTTTCANVSSALACDAQNWNDSTTCSVCRHFVPSTNGRDRCDSVPFTGEPHYDNRGYEDCGYRSAGTSQDCDAGPTYEGPPGSGPYSRLCVCRLAQ